MFRLVVLLGFIATALAGVLPNQYADWEGRIVGGSDAAEGQFPYQVSLRSGTNAHFCGGSIVNTRWALSAAHCTFGRTTANTFVVVGALLLNAGGQSHQSDLIVNHPGYGPLSLTNDISVVRVAVPFVFSANVGPVVLASTFLESATGGQVSGWGQTSHPGSLPNHLQWINVDIITVHDCRGRHTGVNAARVHDNTICSLSPVGIGTCMGDSGGPLTLNGVQQGLVSWGIACAQEFPDVFARVSSHREWILETTN